MVVIKQMKSTDKMFVSDNQNLGIQALKKAMKETKISECTNDIKLFISI